MFKNLLAISIIALTTISCSGKNNSNMNKTTDTTTESDSTKAAINNSSLHLLVGTYTSGTSEGIYLYRFDTISGQSSYLSMAKADNPSYLAISKDENYVYAVAENGNNTAAVNAFAFDKEKSELKFINTQPTGGAAPCYIEIDNTGRHITTANYTGASISLFTTNEDGSLKPSPQVISFQGKGTDPNRQKQPHLHCVRYTPDGKHLFANDLGTDKIHIFDVNPSTSNEHLSASKQPFVKVKDGSGPRHIDFHPNEKYAYLINELSGAVIAFTYNNGTLSEFQSIQADTLNAQGSADIHISPDGRFLYASNRLKGDGIAIFSIDQTNGHLTKAGYQETGIHPRNFIITSNGKFLLSANRDSNVIQVFEIDPSSGLLTDTKQDIKVDMPVCLKFASFK